jgi:hypothetical protein
MTINRRVNNFEHEDQQNNHEENEEGKHLQGPSRSKKKP